MGTEVGAARDFAEALANELPGIDISADGGALVLRRNASRLIIPSAAMGRFSTSERRNRRAEGRNYVDLAAGEIFVNSRGLYIFARVQTAPFRLTPQQCAVLAAEFESGSIGELTEDLRRSPAEFRSGIKARTGIGLSSPATTKLAKALGARRLTIKGKLSASRTLDAVLDQFRLDGVARAVRLPAPARDQIAWVERTVSPGRVVRGVASVLAAEAGSTIEPPDVLLEGNAAAKLIEAVGGPVAEDFRGPSLLVRRLTRLSLNDIAPGSDRISTLLAVAEGLRSDRPIVAESSSRLATRLRSQWT